MRAFTCVALLALLTGCAQPGTTDDPTVTGNLAFVDVNVVDIESGRIAPGQTVVVSGDIVSAIVPATTAIADGIQRVAGQGSYLAPGLMDMHTHVATPDGLALALGYGVTTVRVMWGQPGALELRAVVAAGEVPGPRIVTAGDLMDGHPAIWAAMGQDARSYTDPEAMDAVIAEQKAAGYDFIKTYSRLTPDVFNAILAAGKKHGIEVSGHVPQDVSLRAAVEGGMRTSEHLIGVMQDVLRDSTRPNPDLSVFDERALDFVERVSRGEIDVDELFDPGKVAELGAFLAASEHWLVPTHDIMRNFTEDFQRPFADALRYMSPDQQMLFKVIEDGSFFNLSPEQRDGESKLYVLRSELLKSLHDAGARVLVGTDNSFLSGPAVHEEIKALAKAGFSRLAALQAATLEPGRYLARVGQLGVVAEGASADLILLEANPLDDLDALKKLRGVMTRGTWHDRARLDGLLDGVASRAAEADEQP